MAKDMDLKFGLHASRDSHNMTPEKIWKGSLSRVDPVNFWH